MGLGKGLDFVALRPTMMGSGTNREPSASPTPALQHGSASKDADEVLVHPMRPVTAVLMICRCVSSHCHHLSSQSGQSAEEKGFGSRYAPRA
jgi:hypothetical protein